MANIDNIINLISIVLLLIILFIILFGCHYKGCKYFEGFENNNNNEKPKDKEIKKETDNKELSSFEQSILKGLTDGSLTTDGLTNLIKEEKFTPVNLDRLINYVEKFKGHINN